MYGSEAGREQKALSGEMHQFLPKDAGGLDAMLQNVEFCRTCDMKYDRCPDALESLQNAYAWVQQYAK
ncbi:hypothetical protein LZC95_48965 [Pendulispora brunnea]|uniref:Uncharacterized protein n=1 Tax=Pendulispora brunnea TaxID=2905690 RepID=A0ABZ2K6P6_9BACT